MTAKEYLEVIQKAIAEYGEDIELVSYHSDMERQGYMLHKSAPRVEKMVSMERRTYDRFDGGEYPYTVYVASESKEAKPYLVI